MVFSENSHSGTDVIGYLSEQEVREIVAPALAAAGLAGKRVLLIVPDSTRTAPVGLMFRVIHDLIGRDAAALDVMIALGTHPPMSDEAINRRLEITAEERAGKYAPGADAQPLLGRPRRPDLARARSRRDEIGELSGGLFEMDVPVTINRAIYDYDQLIIVGPVFPHEVVGFSGGNKYLFPGISGAEVLNFFHWLGAVITNPKIIGHKWTPVRRVVDRAAAMVPVAEAGLLPGRPRAPTGGAVRRHARRGVVAGRRPQRPRPYRLQSRTRSTPSCPARP